jgi:lipopolysaccharide biosynthesis glycosyltransferase
MSISDLARAGRVSVAGKGGGEGALASSALAFVFDRKFLEPFKVLLFSLARTGSFTQLPVLVFTQDGLVANDDVVKTVADEVVFIKDEDISKFSVISRKKIPDQYKLDWIPKYTFLKWLIFDDYDLQQLVFIDADIVCLNKADGILDTPPGAGLIGCPRFMESLFSDESGSRLSERQIYGNLKNMARGEFDEKHVRLNSGVLLLRDNVLSSHFREDLLAFASRREHVNEQSYITSFFKNSKEYKMKLISSKYNFGAGSLSYLPVHLQIQVLREVVFLHFPGPRKPWFGELTEDARFTHMVWRKIASDARAQSDLLGARSGQSASDAVTEADM